MKFQSLLLVAAIATVGCSSMHHGDREEAISLSSAPAAVQETAHRVAGANKIEKVTKESEDGQVVYEIEFDVNDVDHSASIAANGDIVEEESEAKFESMPGPVQHAVMNKYPDSKVRECAIEKRQGKMIYEVQVDHAGQRHEIKMTEDGNVQSDKIEHEEGHDKD